MEQGTWNSDGERELSIANEPVKMEPMQGTGTDSSKVTREHGTHTRNMNREQQVTREHGTGIFASFCKKKQLFSFLLSLYFLLKRYSEFFCIKYTEFP